MHAEERDQNTVFDIPETAAKAVFKQTFPALDLPLKIVATSDHSTLENQMRGLLDVNWSFLYGGTFAKDSSHFWIAALHILRLLEHLLFVSWPGRH